MTGEEASAVGAAFTAPLPSPRLSQRFEVQAIPTLLVLRDGKVLAKQVGAAPARVLRTWLDQALAHAPAAAQGGGP